MPDDTETRQEAIAELEAITEELKDIVDRATRTLRGIGGLAEERARHYWLAQLEMLIHNDHEWLGSAGCTIADTIEELGDEEDDENEPPDEGDFGAYLDELDVPSAEDRKKEG